MKVLNLYACLGGNRYKWDEVAEEAGIELQVTAVELDPELAKLYQDRFPNDIVIVADAHQYLLDHFDSFDFVWTSPPCPTHSRLNSMIVKNQGKPRYPQMMLYEEIIILKQWFKGSYVVENVIPYYEPLISAQKRDRHLYWTNFKLPNDIGDRKKKDLNLITRKELELFHEIDLTNYKGNQDKMKIARNLVDYEAGRTIFETALGIIRKKDITQTELFE
jgi:DNA (cytosine-5)-methyltransferase 1